MRIKCPHCNGKGFSEINSALNMTCGWCMGKGELDLEIVPTEPQTEAEIEKKWENTVWDTDVYLDDIDGKEPMTNEEWIKQCNTEQLAEEISHLVFGGDFKKHISKMGYINMHSFKTEIMEWLNQPHNND